MKRAFPESSASLLSLHPIVLFSSNLLHIATANLFTRVHGYSFAVQLIHQLAVFHPFDFCIYGWMDGDWRMCSFFPLHCCIYLIVFSLIELQMKAILCVQSIKTRRRKKQSIPYCFYDNKNLCVAMV